LDPQTVKFARAELFDLMASRHVTDCDIFHGFEQCAAFSLDTARRSGAVTVLDQSIIAWPSYAQRWAAARSRYGLPVFSEPALFRRHVARKAQERERADYFIGGLGEVRCTLEQAGIPGDKVFVIPYGADLSLFSPVERAPSEQLRLLFVGALSWVKGLPLLLEALAHLGDPRVSLRVFGGVDPEWLPLLDRMRRGLDAQGISVDFAGTVPQRDLVRAFQEADAFVFPSLIGSVGLASLQAMATGLPSIAPSEDVILQSEGDALIADPLDPARLAAAIERLRADTALRRHLSHGAIQTARRFTWVAYGRALVAAYERMLAHQPACTFLPGPGESLAVREHSEKGPRS
jgi:glycosyltransferase involved in cell wall biosynthesis